MTDRPHVLVLMCDQMQHQRMGFVDRLAHTPTLNRLAKEGVHFTRAYTCHGQCVPARAAFQTGLYPHECGVMVIYDFHQHQARLTAKYQTIGHLFKDAGYQTAYFGKTHFGVPLADLGYDIDGDSYPMDDEETKEKGLEYVPKSLRCDYRACDDAVAFLQSYTPSDQPLFMTFSTNLPHPPFFTDPTWADRFPPDDLALAPSYYPETFATKPPFQREHVVDGDHGAYAELAQYYTMIAETDAHFGRIVAEYERLGIWNDTVVLFLADHGEMMGAHKMRLKGTLPYEELYRIPCMMKLPKGVEPKRRVVDDLISSVQAPGTLLQAAGIDLPAQFHNGHFYDAPFRDAPPEDEHIFFEHYAAYWGIHPFYAVRTPRFKYARYYGDDACEEMYDLANDPHELTSIAADPSHAAQRAELAQRADTWWQNTDGRDLAYYESDAFKANEHNLAN
ncbi:MAG: sulfatase-like hydrolase/transferase [Candidatus Latescibacterota bacterium]|nr:sulfatase-like hydrolase/transferase [Candidatus Latescibacterota bacterium]